MHMKKKILITGSSGFIGRNLTEALLPAYNVSHPSSTELNLLDDIAVQKYLKRHRFDAVIHCATHNSTKVSPKDLKMVFYNNIRMYLTVARCRQYFGRMFYFGSGAQYDVNHYIPKMSEEYFDTYIPSDDYGFSKYIMNKYADSAKNIYDLVLFGIFGKYEDWRIRFISNTICHALFNMDLTISQNVFFDYLYINDLSNIIKILIEKRTIPYRHINICTGETIDLWSLATIIKRMTGTKRSIVVAKSGLKKEYSGDNSRLLRVIGKYRFTPIDVAITELYGWYRDHLQLIDRNSLNL